MYYVYLLRCGDGSIYCGSTNDVQSRIKAHNAGKGAKYTRSRLPIELAYLQVCADKSEALKLECKIKKLNRVDKLTLIEAFVAK